MYIEYLNRLIQCLHSTKVYDQDGKAFRDYEESMLHLVSLFSKIKKEQKQVYFIGNGGSSAIASHMTADFMKNGGMRTYSLYDNSVTTCILDSRKRDEVKLSTA